MKTLLILASIASFISSAQASDITSTNTKSFELSKTEITAILDVKTKSNIEFPAVILAPIKMPTDMTLIAQQSNRKLSKTRSTKINTNVGDE
jgi:hypothetical protein